MPSPSICCYSSSLQSVAPSTPHHHRFKISPSILHSLRSQQDSHLSSLRKKQGMYWAYKLRYATNIISLIKVFSSVTILIYLFCFCFCFLEDSDMDKEKSHINIVFIGDVNSGKSTTAGHLIFKLGGIDKHVIDALEKEKEEIMKLNWKFKYEAYERYLKYAWVLDKLKLECEGYHSVNVAQGKLETTNYHCTIIDTPGGPNFITNMITGTSQADCAVLIIGENGYEKFKVGQMYEHVLLAFSLGVEQLICCINKIERDAFNDASLYNDIVNETSFYLKKAGYNPEQIPFIPISGGEGYNLTERSTIFNWYQGPTLLEAIDNVKEPKRPCGKPLRLPLQDSGETRYFVVGVGI